jgi:hypothetical protein
LGLEVDAGAMARAAVKTESAGDQLDALHRAFAQVSAPGHDFGGGYFGSLGTSTKFDFDHGLGSDFGTFEGTSSLEAFVVAKPIVASRVPFGPAPAFDPVPYFDEATEEACCRPLEHRLAMPRVPVPPVSVHASRAERNLLFRAMADTNRLVAISACDAGEGPFSGLFAVPKDLDRDRLILDARPPNSFETVLSQWTSSMATASSLSGIELAPDESLLLSGRDVKDFFYQFVVNPQRARRNVMAGLLSPEEFVCHLPEALYGSRICSS